MPINSPLAPKKPKVDASGQLFSGMITDAAGRKQYYRNGEHVAGPQEAAAPKTSVPAAAQPEAMPKTPKVEAANPAASKPAQPSAPKQPRQVSQAKVAAYARQVVDKAGGYSEAIDGISRKMADLEGPGNEEKLAALKVVHEEVARLKKENANHNEESAEAQKDRAIIKADLDTKEEDAIEDYQEADGYWEWNSFLRGHSDDIGDEAKSRIAHMDNAIAKHKTERPLTVFRGMTITPEEAEKMIGEGRHFIDHGFVSTSTHHGTAQSFIEQKKFNKSLAEVSFEIHVPHGAHALPMPANGEAEVLLPRGAAMEIVRVQKTKTAQGKDRYEVKAKYVGYDQGRKKFEAKSMKSPLKKDKPNKFVWQSGDVEWSTDSDVTKALPPKDPSKPGFTGIDAHGHKWVNGRQVAIGDDEPAGQQPKAPEQPAEQQSPDQKAQGYADALKQKFGDQAMERLEAMKQKYASDPAKLNALNLVAEKVSGKADDIPAKMEEKPKKPTEGKALRDISDDDLVNRINSAAGGIKSWNGRQMDAGEKLNHKVFISDVYDAIKSSVGNPTIDEFKDRLWELQQAHKISLGRNDMPQYAHSQDAVKASVIRREGLGHHDTAVQHVINSKPWEAKPDVKPAVRTPVESALADIQDLYENANGDADVHSKVKDAIERMDENLMGKQIKEVAKKFGINDLAGSRQDVLDRISAKVSGRREMFARTEKQKPIPSPLRKKKDKPEISPERAAEKPQHSQQGVAMREVARAVDKLLADPEKGRGGLISIPNVRAAVEKRTGISREAFDEAVLQMWRDGKIQLEQRSHADNTEEDRKLHGKREDALMTDKGSETKHPTYQFWIEKKKP